MLERYLSIGDIIGVSALVVSSAAAWSGTRRATISMLSQQIETLKKEVDELRRQRDELRDENAWLSRRLRAIEDTISRERQSKPS